MSTVGERIFKLRKDKKLSREFLGEKIGVSKTAIKNWEDGQNSPFVVWFIYNAELITPATMAKGWCVYREIELDY